MQGDGDSSLKNGDNKYEEINDEDLDCFKMPELSVSRCRIIQIILCSPLPMLSLSGFDRHDCSSPCSSVECEVWIELVLSQIAPHSVHPPQSGPSSSSLPSYLHRCYLLCNFLVIITWPYHERSFLVTYVVIGLTIASILAFWTFRFYFCISVSVFCPESILAFLSRFCASFAVLLCVTPNTHCHTAIYQSWSDDSFV